MAWFFFHQPTWLSSKPFSLYFISKVCWVFFSSFNQVWNALKMFNTCWGAHHSFDSKTMYSHVAYIQVHMQLMSPSYLFLLHTLTVCDILYLKTGITIQISLIIKLQCVPFSVFTYKRKQKMNAFLLKGSWTDKSTIDSGDSQLSVFHLISKVLLLHQLRKDGTLLMNLLMLKGCWMLTWKRPSPVTTGLVSRLQELAWQLTQVDSYLFSQQEGQLTKCVENKLSFSPRVFLTGKVEICRNVRKTLMARGYISYS